MSDQYIIEIKGAEKRFGNFVAVSDLNLSLKEGEFFSLLGPSGCGKTTALRMMARTGSSKRASMVSPQFWFSANICRVR